MPSTAFIPAMGEAIDAGVGAGTVSRNLVCWNTLELTLPLHHQLIVDMVLASSLVVVYELVRIAKGSELITDILIDFKFLLADGRTDDDVYIIRITVFKLY